MKYICMGYSEPAKLAAMTEDGRNATIQHSNWQMAISFKVDCKPIISQARAPAVHDHSRGIRFCTARAGTHKPNEKGQADRLSLLHRPKEYAILQQPPGVELHLIFEK
jgi:hypothetical protein